MPKTTKSFAWIGLVISLGIVGCISEMSRGSSRTLYTIAGVLEVRHDDLGKDIQLRLDQKLFFNLQNDPETPGQWTLVDYEGRTLLLLSETPRTAPGFWGLLLQARGLGSAYVTLRFTPTDEGKPPQEINFEIAIRR